MFVTAFWTTFGIITGAVAAFATVGVITMVLFGVIAAWPTKKSNVVKLKFKKP